MYIMQNFCTDFIFKNSSICDISLNTEIQISLYQIFYTWVFSSLLYICIHGIAFWSLYLRFCLRNGDKEVQFHYPKRAIST